MTEAEARQRLERMVAHEDVPALSSDEVDDLVVIAKVTDVEGLLPSDTGWTETWNLKAAAREGWRWKAAKAARMHTFSADGASYNRAEIIANCETMIRLYGGTGGSIAVGHRSATGTLTDVQIVGNG